MCGIVGAVAERNITAILLEGLKRLEYRGYDSAGVAVLSDSGRLERLRRNGKVAELETAQQQTQLVGRLGIAHTRWATHGAPCERNAHPHFSGDDLAVVHNGIIENHEALRARLKALGYVFLSDTDTEVIVHLLHHKLDALGDLTAALKEAVKELHGAYGLAVISAKQPDRLLAERSGSPLVIGLGLGENFLASDQLALRQVTDRFMYLEEGDIAEIRRDAVQVWDVNGQPVQREAVQYHEGAEAADKGEYRHFMLKEIHEQPKVVQRTWKAGWAIARCWWRPLVRRPASCSPGCATCRSSPAAPAITPVWWRVTGWKSWPVSLARWRSPASSATARWWCSRTRCSSPFPSPARRPTPWRPCAMPSSWPVETAAIWPAWPSATLASARWCASRT